MIRYEKLRSYLRDHIAAQTDFATALVQLDNGAGSDAFESQVAAGSLAVSIHPFYQFTRDSSAGVPPNVVTVGDASFLIAMAISAATTEEEFNRLTTALVGAVENFYSDEQDRFNSIRVTQGSMLEGEGLRFFLFDCSKLCVMTPNTPDE